MNGSSALCCFSVEEIETFLSNKKHREKAAHAFHQKATGHTTRGGGVTTASLAAVEASGPLTSDCPFCTLALPAHPKKALDLKTEISLNTRIGMSEKDARNSALRAIRVEHKLRALFFNVINFDPSEVQRQKVEHQQKYPSSASSAKTSSSSSPSRPPSDSEPSEGIGPTLTLSLRRTGRRRTRPPKKTLVSSRDWGCQASQTPVPFPRFRPSPPQRNLTILNGTFARVPGV